MAGLVDINNHKRGTAVGQLSYLSGLDSNRRNQNQQINANNKAQRRSRVGSAVGGLATMAMATGPVGMVAGGLAVLGSLF